MDRVIDRNHYPVPETRRSNMRHRPIGIGIQGLADVFIQLRLPFESAQALEVNRLISETMYHAALEASNEIARERGEGIARLDYLREMQTDGGVLREDIAAEMRALEKEFTVTDGERELCDTYPQWRGAYSTFGTSPTASGILQFDMHNVTPTPGRYDWSALKDAIMKNGLRHSLLIALMPTASTSQVMGSTESFEAITSNIFQRRTLAGEFVVINRFLVKDLVGLGLWNRALKDQIIMADGSIQGIASIPDDIKALYKTVWEIKQRATIDQAAARQPYVCQTQSMNLYSPDSDISKMTNMHFYGWKSGLKTGCYYLRSKPRAKVASFSLDPSIGNANRMAAAPAKEAEDAGDAAAACRRDNPEGCLMCSA
jgi:ribonucleotide reductase alpha subunit